MAAARKMQIFPDRRIDPLKASAAITVVHAEDAAPILN